MTLAARALEAAGLLAAVARRVRGEPLTPSDLARAQQADLLALGAAADEVRRADVGDELRIYLTGAPPAGPSFVIVGVEGARGTALVRHLALTRLALPAGGRLCVDVAALGSAFAQASLGFGISDWVNALGGPKQLLIAGRQRDEPRATLEGEIRRASRVAVFVTTGERPRDLDVARGP